MIYPFSLNDFFPSTGMIIINGNEVIDNVKIIDNNTFIRFYIPDFPECLSSSYKSKIIDKNCFCNGLIPFIEYPTSVLIKDEKHKFNLYSFEEVGNVNDITCKIGYVNVNNGQKEISPIIINYITIRKLVIKTTVWKKYYSHGADYNDYFEYSFHFEFVIDIATKKGEYEDHTFHAYTQTCISHYNKKCNYPSGPIFVLLEKIIPLLNDYIDIGHSLKNINYPYLDLLLPQIKDNASDIHPFHFSDALDIVYSMQLFQDKGRVIIELGKKLEPYMNVYIVSLINSILNINLVLDEETKTYKSNISDKLDYPEDTISLRNFLQCILYIGIYENFDIDTSNKEYLTLPSKQNNNISLTKNYLEDYPGVDFLAIYEFISNLEVKYFIDGLTRVGRDDIEWKERTFIIPVKRKFRAKDIIINKINELLDIKLEFQEEVNTSWDDANNHPARYFFFESFDRELVSGLAINRSDLGSSELEKKSFYKLIDYFINSYIAR